MDNAYSNALKRKAELERELADVDQFLTLYRKYESGKTGGPSQQAAPETGSATNHAIPDSAFAGRHRTRPKRRGNPSVIADTVEAVLLDAERPMTRGELEDALNARGIEVPSEDKARYIGTVLWRDARRFVNLTGKGYWLAGLECPEAGYFPAPDQEGSGQSTAPENGYEAPGKADTTDDIFK